MSNFDQSNQNVDSQNNAGRDVIQSIVNHHILPPLEAIKGVWKFALECFQSMLPVTGHDHSRIVQFDDIYHRNIERIEGERLELAKIDSSRRADAERRLIQLREEEVKLQEEKFKWEKSVVQENLKLIRDSHSIAIEYQRKEIQSNSDIHYLPLQVNRDDIIQILSQDDGKFVIISSPPEVLRDDMPAFKSLKAEIPYKLKHAVEKYYGGIKESAISYRNILDNSIGESKASVIGKFAIPIPTLIFHSQVTHQKVIIGITLTCPVVTIDASETQTSEPQFTVQTNQENFVLPEWNWMDMKKELKLKGQDDEESSQIILDLIATIHLIVSLYFCDLYYLNLNPNHSPQLFVFLEEPDFPNGLQRWAEPLQNSLEETQDNIKRELERICALEAENIRYRYGGSDTDLDDFIPAIASGIGLMFLLAMCNQKFPNVYKSNTSIQNSIEQQQGRTGIIRVNRPDANSAGLRVVPEQDGEVIDMLPNGTPVVLGKVSSNGLWQKVIAKDGKSGWVWAEFIQK